MTEPSYLAAVRESYDTVAADYAARVKDPADHDPLSRAMLAAFTEVVRGAGRGPVADLGCGPGKVTAHLLLVGHVGNHEHVRHAQAYGGHPVSYESHLLPPDRIAELLRERDSSAPRDLCRSPRRV
jgi:SAM-dependent methyltransferase